MFSLFFFEKGMYIFLWSEVQMLQTLPPVRLSIEMDSVGEDFGSADVILIVMDIS